MDQEVKETGQGTTAPRASSDDNDDSNDDHDQLPQDETVILQCQHLFHRRCFRTFLAAANEGHLELKCPVCRTDLMLDQSSRPNAGSSDMARAEAGQEEQEPPLEQQREVQPEEID